MNDGFKLKRKNVINFQIINIPRGGARIEKEKLHLHVRRGGASKPTLSGQVDTRKTSSPSSPSSPSSFFPISLSELPHFLSMSLLMFLFIYVFTTVRDTKDTLVVSNCGAEAIPYLKLYAVMPTAFLFIMGYSRLSQFLGKKALFYVTLTPFFVFYALFAFVLFPNRDSIHLAQNTMIKGAAGKAAYSLIQYWSFSLYFIVSELWASAGIPLLFWQVS